MDAAFGVEEWSPQVTDHPLVKRQSCIGTLVAPIDCGNGVCCPLGSKCFTENGVTNCRGGVQGLGSAEVPGLTVSKPASTATAATSASSTSEPSAETGVSTFSTPEASTVTQITTASVSSVSTETVIASLSSPSSSSSSSSESSTLSTFTNTISIISSSSSSLSSSESLISTSTTPTSTISSEVASFTSTLMTGTPSTTAMSSTDQNANSGAAKAGSNSNNNTGGTTSTGGLNVGAAVGIAVGVGVVALAFVLLAFILCTRTRRKKKSEKQQDENQNQNQPRELDRTTEASESERGTAMLPRGGSKTFTDVIEAGRYGARPSTRSSLRSDPFADRPEMTGIGDGMGYRRTSNRGYDRGHDRDSYGGRSYDGRSYDRRTDRSYDNVYERQSTSRAQRDVEPRHNGARRPTSVSTVRTSRSSYPEDEDRRYYPSRDEGRVRSRPGRSRTSPASDFAELDVPEPAATYLRDPFSTPEPRRTRRRSASPKRYLYPEQTDRDVNDDEGEELERAESRADTERSQPMPVNFLPVFAKPVYAVLPGKSGAVVEMI